MYMAWYYFKLFKGARRKIPESCDLHYYIRFLLSFVSTSGNVNCSHIGGKKGSIQLVNLTLKSKEKFFCALLLNTQTRSCHDCQYHQTFPYEFLDRVVME